MDIPPALRRFDTANFRLRVMSSAIMVPVVLLAVYLGSVVYGALIGCAAFLGLYEWLRLVAPDAPERMVGGACAMLVIILAGGFLVSIGFGAGLGVAATVALYFIAMRHKQASPGWVAVGIPYMAGSGLALLAIRGTPGCGAGLVLYLLVTVWGTDIGAYMAGRLIGGAKLAPSISPSKTWAGLFGGMALALVMGYFAALSLGAQHPMAALVLSPLLACVAQAGDLFESAFKRRAGVKESGDLIPGHGGVLDRIDGLVFAGIFMALFQSIAGQQIQWW